MKKSVFLSTIIFLAPVARAESVTVTMSRVTPQGIGDNIGTIEITDEPKGLQLKLHLKSLPPGQHGFHVHEKAACTPGMKEGKMTAAMEAGEFFEATGARPWTAALFVRGQIFIPVTAGSRLGIASLDNSLRHEYAHAVIAELSDGRCPAWLDEGLTQWVEGRPAADLNSMLTRYLSEFPPVPFSSLRKSFTSLEQHLAAAAYAQSLFATENIIESYGHATVRDFLDRLGKGEAVENAFTGSFGLSESALEEKFRTQFVQWPQQIESGVRLKIKAPETVPARKK